jgi:hypothetical protein
MTGHVRKMGIPLSPRVTATRRGHLKFTRRPAYSAVSSPGTGLSAPKSGKMPRSEKLLSTAQQLLAFDQALARGLPIPQRSAFFVLRWQKHAQRRMTGGRPHMVF